MLERERERERERVELLRLDWKNELIVLVYNCAFDLGCKAHIA
jgi:hypothetical protein